MTEPNPPLPHSPGELPPDLPPEYADAYLRGYERAWASSQGDLEPIAEPEPLSSYENLFADAAAPGQADAAVSSPAPGPASAASPEPAWEGPTHREPTVRASKPSWFVPALLGTLIMSLVLGAYVFGRAFSSSVDASPSPGDERLVMPTDPTGKPSTTEQGTGWEGDVSPLDGLTAASSCVLPPGNDASGREVRYDPEQAVDGDFTTAWRCAGSGRGQTLRITLSGPAAVAELGLVPGYAKTDPQSGSDRYAENNRITRVRWTFSNGFSIVQRLDGSPTTRRLQTLRIPPTKADSVTLEVLASVKAPRNTIAISEVELSEPVR